MEEERWVMRPLHITIYNIIENIISKKRMYKKDEMVTYDELLNELKERVSYIDEDEILKSLMKLELWSFIDVVNNGATLEIRLRGGMGGR